MIPGEKPIVMAERHQIDEVAEIAKEFFSLVLGMDYDACFVSDESRLSDFSGWGRLRKRKKSYAKLGCSFSSRLSRLVTNASD